MRKDKKYGITFGVIGKKPKFGKTTRRIIKYNASDLKLVSLMKPFFKYVLLSTLMLCALRSNAQTPTDAALIDQARIMNFVDWYRNTTNGAYGYSNPGKVVPDAFFNDIPFYAVDNYASFQGTYRGKTWNRTSNKFGDSWLTLGNIDYNNGTICLKAEWFNGLVGSVHLEANLSQSNIFTGEGQLYFDNQAMYDIHMFVFMLNNRSMKGVCILLPLNDQRYGQCSTFVLGK